MPSIVGSPSQLGLLGTAVIQTINNDNKTSYPLLARCVKSLFLLMPECELLLLMGVMPAK